MTLKLDLTTSQQGLIKPLLFDKISKKKVMFEKRKAIKKANKKQPKLSKSERFEKEAQLLDAKIAFKAKMKRILNEQQYEKFEKMSDKKRTKKDKRNNKKEKRRTHKKK